MEFNELMENFAEKCGINDMVIGDGGVALEVDGAVFAFVHDSGAGLLTVVADLGQQSVDANGPFGAVMLQANFLFRATRGATLCQNPDSKSYGLQQQYRLAYLDVDTLASEVEKLANAADEWRAILSGVRSVEDALETRKSEDAAAGKFASVGDFMRV